MTHCSDDDLVLHFYAEDDGPASHLAACATCAARYRALVSLLQAVIPQDVPERGDQYGREVWQRIRHRLPDREPWWRVPVAWTWAAAAATAIALVAAGFTAGRLSAPPSDSIAPTARRIASATDDVQRRVLLLSVADHLERSDRVLTDIVNAPGGHDISAEQAWAVELVAASRLYRQEAIDTNEASLAAVLDEVERTLLEIAHHPSPVTDQDMQDIRGRIDAAALLFKVRVVSTELRALTDDDTDPSTDTPSTIG